MSDTTDTTPTEFPANDDPLQVINLIEEAMQLQLQSSPAVVEEAHNLEALTESYSSYVTAYTETFATAWDASMKAYQTEVDAWQAAVAKFKAQNQVGNAPKAPHQAVSALMNSINAAADDAAKGSGATAKAGPSRPAKKPQG